MKFDANLIRCFEQMPGYITVKNLDSICIWGNLPMAKILGYSTLDDFIGRTDYDSPCPASNFAKDFIDQDEQAIQQNKALHFLDVITYSDNQIKAMLTIKKPYYDVEEKVSGVFCQSNDLTEKLINNILYHLMKLDFGKKPKLNASYQVSNQPIQNEQTVELTQRESEILFYLLRGLSAKRSGIILDLSHRTVEKYIERIKHKFKCSTKDELILKCSQNTWMNTIPESLLSMHHQNALAQLADE